MKNWQKAFFTFVLAFTASKICAAAETTSQGSCKLAQLNESISLIESAKLPDMKESTANQKEAMPLSSSLLLDLAPMSEYFSPAPITAKGLTDLIGRYLDLVKRENTVLTGKIIDQDLALLNRICLELQMKKGDPLEVDLIPLIKSLEGVDHPVEKNKKIKKKKKK